MDIWWEIHDKTRTNLKWQFSSWMLLFTNIEILYENCYNALDYGFKTFIHRFSFFLAKEASEIIYLPWKPKQGFVYICRGELSL